MRQVSSDEWPGGRPRGRACAVRRLLVLLCAGLGMPAAGLAHGQQPNPIGSLLIVVQPAASHLTFSFVNGTGAGTPGICSITGAGAATATLNLGTASIASDDTSCVTFTAGTGGRSYTLGNTFYVKVTKTGKTSSYTLTAKLASSAPTGVSWSAGGQALSTTAVTLLTAGTYSSNTPLGLSVTVQGTVTTTNLAQTIDFVATAN